MNKTSVLELTFYAVLQRSEKQQLIRKIATQTLDKTSRQIFQKLYLHCLSEIYIFNEEKSI